MVKQHTKQFKQDEVQYYMTHKDLGIGCSTLNKWLKELKVNREISVRGSGNYVSDEQKEIARLKRQLRDTQDALDVLKKAISILRK